MNTIKRDNIQRSVRRALYDGLFYSVRVYDGFLWKRGHVGKRQHAWVKIGALAPEDLVYATQVVEQERTEEETEDNDSLVCGCNCIRCPACGHYRHGIALCTACGTEDPDDGEETP